MQEPSQFWRWRPTFHVQAPRMWMNDPCGAVYVPETGEYLVLYQWYTGGTKWGSSAWGLARSKDLIRWTDGPPAIELGPAGSSECKGVFSGSVTSKLDREGKRVLYLFYTSVNHLPIHWSIPYHVGCETQSVAISTDYGHTWQKRGSNPLALRAPLGEKTTGWRDPFVSTWPSLSRLLARNTPSNRSRSGSDLSGTVDLSVASSSVTSCFDLPLLGTSQADPSYMLISSGCRGVGPQLRLYVSEDPELEEWREFGVLLSLEKQTKWSSCCPDFGVNFECGSFFSLEGRDYIVVGVEGGEPHRGRWVLWLEGQLVLDESGGAKFEIVNCGKLDHGIFYSASLFRGPSSKPPTQERELLLWGWADEDDQDRDRTEQGWAGSLTTPRELFILTAEKPAGTEAVPAGWSLSSFGDETIYTLGIRPAPQVAELRAGAEVFGGEELSRVRSKHFEIDSTFTPSSDIESLGFKLRMSDDGREYTTILISPPTSSITLDRTHSSLLPFPNKFPITASFELLPAPNPITADSPWEALKVRVFVDNSMLEVFVNERFALTTRVYPSLEDAVGVEFFSFSSASTDKGGESGIVRGEIRVYTNLVRAWESRDGSDGSRVV